MSVTPSLPSSPIFVVGTGRSGTTLLRMMLNAHPRIYLTHEASFYLSLGGLPRDVTAERWLERYTRTFSFRWLGLTPGEVTAAMPDGPGPHALRDGILAVMQAKARHYGKPRCGDKTPNHSLCLKRIFAHFPDARVVHIVRDPRWAVESLNRMPWAASSIALNSFYVDQQVRAVRRFAGRIHELRLEDLLRDPEPAMRAVLDYLGEPWDAAVLDHEHHAPTDDIPPFPWFLDARRNIDRGRAAPSLRLPPVWIRVVEGMNGFTMRTYGYARMPLSPEPGFAARWRARLSELPEVGASLRRLVQLGRRAHQTGLPEPRRDQEELLALNPRAWQHYPGFVMPLPP